MPSEAQAEVTAIATSPAVQAVAPEAGRMEEDTAGGSSGIMAVVERTHRRSPLALLSGGSHSPAWGGAAAPVDGRRGPNIGSFLA